MKNVKTAKLRTSLKSVADTLLTSIFPWQCPACLETSISWDYSPICPACWQQIQYTPTWCCLRCGKVVPALKYHDRSSTSFDDAVLCPDCTDTESACTCEAIRSALVYTRQGTARAAILALKHSRMLSLVRPLSRVMQEQYERLMPPGQIDMVIPVPLHRHRLLVRGFNQAGLLADRMARHLKTEQNHRLLVRTRPTPPQSGKRKDRKKNVAGAFRVTKPSALKGKRVLLIDDVMTTGATLEACAQQLIAAGCQSVRAMTVARVPG